MCICSVQARPAQKPDMFVTLSKWSLAIGTIGLALAIICGLNLQGTLTWGMNHTFAQVGLYVGGIATLFLIPGIFGTCVSSCDFNN